MRMSPFDSAQGDTLNGYALFLVRVKKDYK
jgi:hypothetical protein